MNGRPLRIPEARRTGGMASVLIVVDDRDLRSRIVSSLADVQGLNITEASTAHEAINSIQSRVPDVALIEVSLPDLDGFRLCKLLKLPLTAGTEQLPVVLVSHAYRDVLAEHVARKAHAFAFLKLPAEMNLLPRTIELAIHRLLQESADQQLLNHKGDVHLLIADDSLATTLSTALELDGWRVVRFRSAEEMALKSTGALPQVAFVDVTSSASLNPGRYWEHLKDEAPVIVALLRRAEPDHLLGLMEHGVDDYITYPVDPGKLVEACREARLKYNFRNMHNEFDSQLMKMRVVSDYLDLVITNSHEAIFTCDQNGLVKLWNKGAERVYGWEADEILGKNVDEYLDPPGFTRKSPNVVRLLRQRGSMTDPEVQRMRKSGEVFPVSATYTLLTDPDGEVLGFSVIERDVTTVKALENERIKSARLRAITQTAVTANDHINTPLGIILGYAQFLELKLATVDQQDRNALEVIQQQVHKIKGIMNKLKLISDPIVKNYSIEGVTMLDLTNSQLSDETTN